MFTSILLLSFCLYMTVTHGFNYEVEVEPLKYASQAPLEGSPTGGYTFLGVAKKKAPTNHGSQIRHNKDEASELFNTSPGYRYILDLTLVLDSSYTITLEGWIRIKEAAKKLIDRLDISPEGTHVSIMKFSTDVEAYYIFDAKAGKDDLIKQIDDLEYDNEWSRLDMALEAVDHHVFTPFGGARLGKVPKAVVIFSDGKTDGPSSPDEEIDWQQKVAEPLNSLRKKNIPVFCVASGEPDQAALEAITDDPKRVFDLHHIDELVEGIEDVSEKVPIEPVTVTVTVTAPAEQKQTETPPLTVHGTRTVTTTEIVTKAVTSTPVATVVATETQTALVTATETATTLMVTATATDTLTETVTTVATESITSTSFDTATISLTTTLTATEVVTLTTTLGVTVTSYASAVETPIPITIVGSVIGKKKSKIPRVKRWYTDYIPSFIKRWMAIKE